MLITLLRCLKYRMKGTRADRTRHVVPNLHACMRIELGCATINNKRIGIRNIEGERRNEQERELELPSKLVIGTSSRQLSPVRIGRA
jgi:hypothetical protein